MVKRVTVKVPATSANLGPGFDCMAVALDIWNSVQVEVGSEAVTVRGEGEQTLSRGPDNLVYRSVSIPFKEASLSVPKLSMSCHNIIPLSRGLGSSAAAIVGGLLAGNELCGRPLRQTRILELAVETEGHPDNVTAALLGGCQIVVRENGNLKTASVPLPSDLTAVLYIPDMPMPTKEAREILPKAVSREDAVYNIGRVALLVNGFATGDLEHLRVATQDRLHQPPRQTIFPAMKPIFESALDAGALAVFLSGGGSTILALAKDREETIGRRMATASEKHGITGRFRVARFSQRGAYIADSA